MKKIFLAMLLFFCATVIHAEISCQTSEEIRNHLENSPFNGEKFCFHRVVDPSHALKSGELIPRFNRLRHGLEIAFLDVQKDTNEIRSLCQELGDNWQLPKSNHIAASPRAENNKASLEAIGEYLKGAAKNIVWSGSRTRWAYNYLWNLNLETGMPHFDISYVTSNVICVRL